MLNSTQYPFHTVVGMYNYYICDMGNRNIAEERPAAPATGKNTSPSEAVAQNTTTATNTAKTAEDAELRKKVEARTEYLNSIKLLLS